MKLGPPNNSAGSPRVRRACREGGQSGFTLVEMLVAFAVGALVLVSLTSIVSQSMAVSRKSNNVLLSNNAASTALDLVTRDLESLTVTGNAYEYLQVLKEDVAGVTNVARLLMLSSGGFDATNSSDFAQARAISYRLIHQDPINPGGARPIYGLYRSAASAQETFATYLGQTNLAVPFNALTASLDDFVVGNVIDFQVRFFPDGNQAAANVSGTTLQSVRISGTATGIDGSAYTGSPLAWAEVSLTILQDRDDALSRFESGALSLEDARSKYGFRLSRRVPIRTPF